MPRKGARPVQPSVREMLDGEPIGEAMQKRLATFRNDVMLSKLRLHTSYLDQGGAVASAASARRPAHRRWSTMPLDEAIIDDVCEIPGSLKIGKCMPDADPGCR